MARIEGSTVKMTAPLEKRAIEPARLAAQPSLAAQLSRPEATASGFDNLRRKLVSVSGSYVANPPSTGVNAALQQFISGQRLAQQAGGGLREPPANKSLTNALGRMGLADGAGSLGALSLESLELNKMEAGTKKSSTRPGEAIGRKLAGLSMEKAGEAIALLSPKELTQLEAAVKAGKVTGKEIVGALLNGKAAGDQVALLKGLPAKTMDGLRELVRSGATDKNANIAVAVGIEVAAQTKWGKANPKAVQKLREAHTEYKIVGNLGEGLGAAADGAIRFKKELLKSPEALAAVLAHEGTHLHQGTSCCGGQGASSLAGETEGNVASAKVWEQMGDKSDPALAKTTLEQLNAYSAAFKKGGTAEVKKRVGAAYIKNAEEKIAERKLDSPSTAAARKPDDTLAAWEAQAEKFRKDLAKDK